MRKYSKFLGKYYEGDDVWYITNMTQNAKYWEYGNIYGDIVDIFAEDGKMIFVYRKTNNMKKLYEKWNNHEL